jgi:uncharacterized protein (DUF1330 family)
LALAIFGKPIGLPNEKVKIRRGGYKMAAYVIARMTITDWEKYKEYIKATPAVIAKYEGKFLCRGGEIMTLEGPEETQRMV